MSVDLTEVLIILFLMTEVSSVHAFIIGVDLLTVVMDLLID